MLKNKFCLDESNKRLNNYIPYLTDEAISNIENLEKEKFVEKSIIYTLKEHEESFLDAGYHREGAVKGFFSGKDAVILSKFLYSMRGKSTSLYKNKVLEIVEEDEKAVGNIDFNQDEFQLVLLQPDQVDELCELYRKVFDFYPTDIFNPVYVKELMHNHTIFVVALKEGNIVSAASAMIDYGYLSAEITDCVTDPEYRGRNILAHIILKLEGILHSQQIHSLFSLTRANSVGMNLNIKRLGYRYDGTLVNNCKIFSGYEDMNVWSKEISSKK